MDARPIQSVPEAARLRDECRQVRQNLGKRWRKQKQTGECQHIMVHVVAEHIDGDLMAEWVQCADCAERGSIDQRTGLFVPDKPAHDE